MILAVIRVKGGFKIKKGLKDTFSLMRLNKKHHCVLLEDNPINLGMIRKVQDFITWGEIDEETLKSLILKRGRLPGNKRVELSEKELNSLVKKLLKGEGTKIKPVFRLSPPKKGWERGTIKLRYPRGALGPRGSEINSLIKRMF